MFLLRFLWKYKIGALLGGIYAIFYLFIYLPHWPDFSAVSFVFWPAELTSLSIAVPLIILGHIVGVDTITCSLGEACTSWGEFLVPIGLVVGYIITFVVLLYLGGLVEIFVRGKIANRFKHVEPTTKA